MQWPAYPPPVPRTFGPLTTKEQELDALKRQTEFLQQALDELRTRIGEVESSTEGQKNK
jgi:prefoldin subunit 5